MFAMSEFEGTRYLGLLVSITLGVAMFTNLLLLPSLLLAFEKSLTTKSFSEPFFSIRDEEEDIEIEELEIQKGFSPGKGDEQHERLRTLRSKSDTLDSPVEPEIRGVQYTPKERNNVSRGIGHAVVASHQGGEQAAVACL